MTTDISKYFFSDLRRIVSFYTQCLSTIQVGTVCRITNTLLPIADSYRGTILEIEQRVERETQLINLLSDNLLYLTRVEEGRALTVTEQPNTLQVLEDFFFSFHSFLPVSLNSS